MIGSLSPSQIDELLHNEFVARIGCQGRGHVYVVPTNYVYHAGAIICYAPDGLKLKMMRENPNVCVEVDHVEDLANWRSVIASGVFQELSGSEAETALALLAARLRALSTGAAAEPSHGLDKHARALNLKRYCVYRIKIASTTGRFETPDA